MSSITISLDEDLLESLREQSSLRGTTVEALLLSQARRLNDVFLSSPHPVDILVGTVHSDVDLIAEYHSYLEEKYK
jgi:hypothetical protein